MHGNVHKPRAPPEWVPLFHPLLHQNRGPRNHQRQAARDCDKYELRMPACNSSVKHHRVVLRTGLASEQPRVQDAHILCGVFLMLVIRMRDRSCNDICALRCCELSGCIWYISRAMPIQRNSARNLQPSPPGGTSQCRLFLCHRPPLSLWKDSHLKAPQRRALHVHPLLSQRRPPQRRAPVRRACTWHIVAKRSVGPVGGGRVPVAASASAWAVAAVRLCQCKGIVVYYHNSKAVW